MSVDSSSLIREKGQRLQSVRELVRFNRKDISNILGISFYTYKGWEVGKHDGLSETLARKLLDLLEAEGVICSFEWLMHGIGSEPKRIKGYDLNSNFSKEKTSLSQHNQEKTEEQIIDEELQFFCQHCKNPIYLQLNDDTMLPGFLMRDIVAGEVLPKRKYRDLIGQPTIIQLKSGEVFLRLLQNGTERNRYTLVCSNPNTTKAFALPNIEIANLAAILWMRRNKLKV